MKMRFRLKRGKYSYQDTDGNAVVKHAGDIVECEPEKLKFFMDKFEQVDPDPPLPAPPVGLTMARASEEPNQWNVINEATGKRINDIPLGLRDAQALVRENKAMMQEEDATEEE
jgi:hypothetical protein